MPIDAKSSKAAVADILGSARTAIKNGAAFSVCTVELTGPKTGEDDLGGFASFDEVNVLLRHVLSEDLKQRVIPSQVLEKMKKAGKEPSASPADIVVVAITNSATHVHLAISCSNVLQRLPADDALQALIDGLDALGKTKEIVSQEQHRYLITYPSESAFKARDEARQRVCALMKDIGAVPDGDEDEDGDDKLPFTLNDL